MLQRFSFVPGNEIGKPPGILGVVAGITHFKTDDSLEETTNDNFINTSTVLFKRIYLPDEKLLTLTKRELEILQLMSQG